MGKQAQFRLKTKKNMDILQSQMESNTHLQEPLLVQTQLEQCRFYWIFLSEEDRDYCQGVSYALDNKLSWT